MSSLRKRLNKTAGNDMRKLLNMIEDSLVNNKITLLEESNFENEGFIAFNFEGYGYTLTINTANQYNSKGEDNNE